ncbi:MAG TPA: type I methionyl aminopeptidase [Acidimicrobiaceae bacterium]|nr:type I methionyl aminopeptidase [Acidimicrobiaceae bacterium]
MTKRKRRREPLAQRSEPPVRPGLQSPRRTVPARIGRPPYAETGDPGPSTSPLVRTPDEVERMRRAGAAAAEILLEVGPEVCPGVTTDHIDELVHEATIARGGYPSPLNYRGYPKSVCTSVNEVICHGIPDSRPLADGDIINVDVTIYLDGVHGDTSVTFAVGEIADEDRRLVVETWVAMCEGITAVAPGQPVHAIGRSIERHARRHGLGVVREFIGHGIGTEFHSGLQIPHYYDPRASTILEAGMTFTVEPMLTLGDPACGMWNDNWTAVTLDGRRTAQFEHTVLVTKDGVELLTVASDGTIPAEAFSVATPA